MDLFNIGPDFNVVTLGDYKAWFSFNTIIAFRSPASGLVVTKNKWGPKTGKHINAIKAAADQIVDHATLVEMANGVFTQDRVL